MSDISLFAAYRIYLLTGTGGCKVCHKIYPQNVFNCANLVIAWAAFSIYVLRITYYALWLVNNFAGMSPLVSKLAGCKGEEGQGDRAS